jgi:hypothetical protein
MACHLSACDELQRNILGASTFATANEGVEKPDLRAADCLAALAA